VLQKVQFTGSQRKKNERFYRYFLMKKDSLKITAKDTFKDELSNACKGLVFISETDADVEPYLGSMSDEISKAAFLDELGLQPETTIDETPFDLFFDRLTLARDWHGSTERRRTEMFAKLKEVLEDNLDGLRVFRIGTIRIDIYVIGLDSEGRVTGIKTSAVET